MTASLVTLLAGGCAVPVSRQEVLELASGGDAASREQDPPPSPDTVPMRTTVAELARLELELLDGGAIGPESEPRLQAILAHDESLADAATPASDALGAVRERLAHARSAEPRWNDVHYAWGVFLAVIGLPPRGAYALLDHWERFEHDSALGRRLDLSLDEAAYGYLWDLEHGMAGYSAAARFLHGDRSDNEEAYPQSRRGGYGD